MRDTIRRTTERLASAPDYWAETRRAVVPFESLDGMLPVSRALPDCSLALDLFSDNVRACRAFLRIIQAAIAALGRSAKDGAHLFIDNFRNKVEHVGHWRKDKSRREWVRIPVHGDVVPDLAGIGSIVIDSQQMCSVRQLEGWET